MNSIDWKNYYNREHEIYRFTPQHDPAENWRVAFVTALLPASQLDRVLDAGCGDGHLCGVLATRARRVTGCDIAFPRLQLARQSVPVSMAELTRPPYRTGVFDLVTLVEVLEHLPEPVPVLRALAGLSRRHLLVTVPYKQRLQIALCPHCLKSFPLDGHLTEFDEPALRAMLAEAGLRVVKLDKFFPPAAWEQSAAIRWWPRAGREALRRLLQACGLVAKDNAL